MYGLMDLRYAEVDGWTAVELPYQEGFAARVVLPPDGLDPATIDPATIDPGLMARIDAALDTATPSSVAVALPQFDVAATTDLDHILRGQGLTAIFDPASESFHGITTQPELFVGQAVQQATITVGEQGTIAAAVTEIGMSAGSMPAPPEHEFVADRPFLMTVQETSTGWDLFQAVVRSVE